MKDGQLYQEEKNSYLRYNSYMAVRPIPNYGTFDSFVEAPAKKAPTFFESMSSLGSVAVSAVTTNVNIIAGVAVSSLTAAGKNIATGVLVAGAYNESSKPVPITVTNSDSSSGVKTLTASGNSAINITEKRPDGSEVVQTFRYR